MSAVMASYDFVYDRFHLKLTTRRCWNDVYWICCFAERGSKEFNDFLALLGDRIKLRGWDKYRGGLDTKSKNKVIFCFCFTCLYTQ